MGKMKALFAFGVLGTCLMFALAWLVVADTEVRGRRFTLVGYLFCFLAVAGGLWGIYSFGFGDGGTGEEGWGAIVGFLGLVSALPLGGIGALFIRAGRTPLNLP